MDKIHDVKWKASIIARKSRHIKCTHIRPTDKCGIERDGESVREGEGRRVGRKREAVTRSEKEREREMKRVRLIRIGSIARSRYWIIKNCRAHFAGARNPSGRGPRSRGTKGSLKKCPKAIISGYIIIRALLIHIKNTIFYPNDQNARQPAPFWRTRFESRTLCGIIIRDYVPACACR